jgi:alpha-L-fucosidase
VQSQPESRSHHDACMEWWRNARFGMFIHWGLYSIPAGEWNGKTGYGEWIRNSAEIPLSTYDRFVQQFNPTKFDAEEWVKMAKDAGMQYIVITAKHHDGFCMFGTRQTDFSVLSTPFGRDPMKDLADACRKNGIRLCFYYSIMDWHHPDYLPRRNWEKDRPEDNADFSKYVEYMKAELKELLTNYGDIGVLWFDGEWEETWNESFGKEIYSYCRSLQPDIIINNRVGSGRMDMEGMTNAGMFGGDFATPEQQVPAEGMTGTDWETCMTMNDHWGYNSHDHNFKSASVLIRTLADVVSKGGNFLLNVGPTAEGLFPPESTTLLNEIGKWMSVNGKSIHGTVPGPINSGTHERCTMKTASSGTSLYFHLFRWPEDKKLTIRGCLNDPKTIHLLADTPKQVCTFERNEDALIIHLPGSMPDTSDAVLALVFKGKPDINDPPEIITAFDLMIDSLTVQLRSSRENVQIRYTLDGTVPGIKSALYTRPFTLKDPWTISARCFRNEKAVSGTSSRKISRVDPIPACHPEKNPVSGISYTYYEGTWDSLPDLKRLSTTKSGNIQNFDLSVKNRKEYFAVLYVGYIDIADDGVYELYIASDDGSRLFVDDRLVTNNDGLHGLKETSGITALAKGYHKIRAEFFQKTGSAELYVSIRGVNQQKQIVPDNLLFR